MNDETTADRCYVDALNVYTYNDRLYRAMHLRRHSRRWDSVNRYNDIRLFKLLYDMMA